MLHPAQDEGGHAGHWSPGWCVGSVSQLIRPALSQKIPEPGSQLGARPRGQNLAPVPVPAAFGRDGRALGAPQGRGV